MGMGIVVDNSDFLAKAKLWASDKYFSESDRLKLSSLIANDNEVELKERFLKDLEFGTGGLRSIVGLGSAYINIYNVKRAAWALGSYYKEKNPNNKNVAISYDSRLTSKEYAEACAKVLLALGMKVYMVDRPTPTPILSYAVRFLDCSCGIMLTASHNPKEYNGFKAYDATGCQVTPSDDQEIIEKFDSLESWGNILEADSLDHPEFHYFEKKLYDSYFEEIKSQSLCPDLIKEKGGQLNIVYTPLHGTGAEFCARAADDAGFTNFKVLASQGAPDGNFPTVEFPNPEEPASLDLAVKEMIKTKADLVIASDPDTDRMGIVYSNGGEEFYFNGNEIAELMLYYKLERFKKLGKITPKSLVLKTIVTSYLQDKMCDAYGVKVINSLTGFKWMGKILNDLDAKGTEYDYIFGSEESFGSMSHDKVRDKDGVSSAVLFSELTLYFHEIGLNLNQVLEQIYKEFGYFKESLLSLTFKGLSGKDKISNLMNSFRKVEHGFFPDYEIESVDDYSTLTRSFYQNESQNCKLDFPLKSNVLGFNFTNGNKVFVRPSGTEPKIKFYLHFFNEDSSAKELIDSEIEKIEKFLRDFCEAI
jgi:phosphoglucomutase